MTYLPAAYAKAIEFSQSAEIHSHVIGDVYLYSTKIKDFYIIAGLQADVQELAEAVLAQAAIAQTIANGAGDIQ